jgi:hypothetical protein
MVSLIVLIVAIWVAVRLVNAPWRYRSRYDNPYRYGCRRRHRYVGGLMPIVALVVLDRMFGGRRF